MNENDMKKLSQSKKKETLYFPITTMSDKHRDDEVHCENNESLYDFDKTAGIFSSVNKKPKKRSCDFIFFSKGGKVICIEAKGISLNSIKNRNIEKDELRGKRCDTVEIVCDIAKQHNISLEDTDFNFYLLFTKLSNLEKIMLNESPQFNKSPQFSKNLLSSISYDDWLICRDVEALLTNKHLPLNTARVYTSS